MKIDYYKLAYNYLKKSVDKLSLRSGVNKVKLINLGLLS